MRILWPDPAGPAADLSDDDLERLYAYPEPLSEPWVQVNFVASADGAVTVDNRSAGLSSPGDKRVFSLGRDLADVILVGAATVRAERYRGVRTAEVRKDRRARHLLAPVPPLAVVSGRCSLPPTAPIFTDTQVPPMVFTCASAPTERIQAIADTGAEVIVAGEDDLDLPSVMASLAKRGLNRVDCEGGPRLFASMLAADLVDQLCLTVAPLLTGAGPGRIVAGALSPAPRTLELASVLHEDGFLLLRYRKPA